MIRRAQRRPWALITLAVVAPTLGASNCKNKPPDVIDKPLDDQVVKVASVETTLQAVSLRPAAVSPNQAFEVSIFGSGFQEGASVLLGDDLLGTTTWEGDNSLRWKVPGQQVGVYDVTVRNPDQEESTLFGALSVRDTRSDCFEVRIYFDLNRAGLTDDAKRMLDDKLACYRESSGRVVVEGHADERGTTDYNLALGQRRAEAVRRHLVHGGLPPARARTVTYGEERPLDPGHTEEAWAQNRRAEVRLHE